MNKFLVSIICFLTGVSCMGDPVPGVTDTEVVFGAHTIESGTFAAFGNSPKASSAYFDKINAQGGVAGRKIRFIRKDVQFDVSRAIQATKQLVEEDHIFAMFASQGAVHQGVYKYLIEKKIPDLAIIETTNVYSKPFLPSAIMATAPNDLESASIVRFIGPKNKGKKACFLTVDSPFGRDFTQGALDQITEINKTFSEQDKIKMGANEGVNLTATQVNTQVLKLKREMCDLVFSSMVFPIATSAISYANSQGFKPLWIMISTNATEAFLPLVPEAVRNGIISSSLFALNDGFNVPGWSDYSDLMKKSGLPISKATVSGYANAEFLVEALKVAGKNLTHENILKASESLTGTTCSVCLKPRVLSPTNHWMYNEPVLVISKENKWVNLN